MASRVLLISTNTYVTPDPVFPLGLAHLASALRKAGHEVFWQDNLARPRPIEEAMREAQPDCVGISVRNIDDVLIRTRETFFSTLPDLCGRIRSLKNCPIVLGGSGYSIFPSELLQLSGADYGVCGPGELALIELIQCFEDGTDPSGVPGLVRRAGGGVVCNAPSAEGYEASLEGGLDGVTDFYIRNGGMLNVQTQRGCKHRCCYCTYPLIEGRHHQCRSGEAVAEDFARAIRAGARYVCVTDSIFNSSLAHVHQVCEALLRKDIKVPWGCFLRPEGLTASAMDLMGRAGLNHIEFGSDSFSDPVLKCSGKGFALEDVVRSSELARARQIDYCHFLICGGPGETDATIEESFRNSTLMDGAIIMAVVGMRIYPGTPLYRRAMEEGRIAPDHNLLEPCYYVAPGLDADQVFAKIKRHAATASNWVAGEVTPQYQRFVERLRSRGVPGPLWGYLSMIQRLMPEKLRPTQQG